MFMPARQLPWLPSGTQVPDLNGTVLEPCEQGRAVSGQRQLEKLFAVVTFTHGRPVRPIGIAQIPHIDAAAPPFACYRPPPIRGQGYRPRPSTKGARSDLDCWLRLLTLHDQDDLERAEPAPCVTGSTTCPPA
jgi:hypothetical protein